MSVRPRPLDGRARPRAARDEAGIALIVSMLIMLISTIVVVGILQLATHTGQRSGLNRNQTAALNAAEAGIQAELAAISDGSCPTAAGSETALPTQTNPAASYIIQAPVSCTANGAAVVAATGYVPSATRPVYSTTMVAHITRNLGAPVSNGGYDFPDALYSDGALSAPSGLNLYGSGGTIPNVTAGSVSIGGTGSILNGSVAGQLLYGQSSGANGSVSVGASQIGGEVTGSNVTVSGPGSGLTVQQGVAASGNLSLSNVTLPSGQSGSYGGSLSESNSSGSTSHSSPSLPLGRPLGSFTNSAGTIGSALGVGTSPSTACPSTSSGWTSSFYEVSGPCNLGYANPTYTPSAGNEATVIVVQGPFNLTVPPTSVGGQLYVVDAGGANDSLTIVGSGSTLPVFAFTDGSVNLSGVLVGQIAGHSITVGSGTSMTFSPPTTPMPAISFPTGYTAPSFTSGQGVSTISYEYQCPGTTAC